MTPRRTSFTRTDSRGRTEPLAANLSLLAVIVAPEPVPDPYIATVISRAQRCADITGIVIINKLELASAATAQFRALVDEYAAAGYHVLRLSAHDPRAWRRSRLG